MGKLDGKVAVVTGGSSGIGAASAELFAKEGAAVVILARNQIGGCTEEEKLKSINPNSVSLFLSCDVTKKEDISRTKNEILSRFGKIDILMNNAGVLRTGALEEITDEDWDLSFDTNVKAVMHFCQAFMPALKDSSGVIINNASINGLNSYIKGRKSYMYASSKAALIQFTKYLAKNNAPEVRVNCLCPGMTITNLFTNRDFSRFKGCNLLDRMAQPEEIAKAALFLASDDSSFMTGSVLVVDGGETLM